MNCIPHPVHDSDIRPAVLPTMGPASRPAKAVSPLPDAAWLAGVLDALTVQIVVLDSRGGIVAVNSAWSRFVAQNGPPLADLGVGANYLGMLRGEAARGDGLAAHALAGLNAVLDGRSAQFDLEFPRRCGQEERWFLMQATPQAQGCVLAHIDISVRKRAEQSHARLAGVLEATTDFVGMADVQGRELYINRALRQLRGLDPDGRELGTIADTHPEWALRRIRDEALPTALREGVWSGEVAVLAHSGEEIPVHQVILAHRRADGSLDFYSTIMRDISASKRQESELRQAFTELQQAQAQLLQSEKMASIGQLAAGVAHEINNPIGYVQSNLGTLGQYLGEMLAVVATYEDGLSAIVDSRVRETIARKKQETDFAFLLEDIPKLLTESREGIQLVRKIVQSLKDFAHAGDGEDWQWADLRHGLERTLNIVNNELKYKAEVHREFGDIPEVRCLPGQLNQVFMNLLVNAAHAIDTHGEVHVRTGQVGGEVWVEVADTGAGIAPEVMQRIFDPFFTTKPMGKGTGLGLSISYGIVKKHGGRIEVSSQVGQGTTFRVILPQSGPAPAAAADA